MKISEADKWFSRCVRERDHWTCQRCGKQYEEGSQGIHCSHNFSRRHRTIRWCGDNALALCYSCHEWYGGNPPDSGAWLESKVGEGTVDILREKMRSGIKVSKLEEKEIGKYYKELYEEMRKGLRKFVSYQ